MTVRRMALACAITLAALSQPAGAATDPVTLGAVNVIKGSSIKAIPVRIPSPARISLVYGEDLILKGSGRVIGIVLSQWDASKHNRTVLVGAREALCYDGAACEKAGWVTSMNARGWPSEDTLPAGRYMLYVIADGEPVEATLTLQGLSGRVVLRPSIKTQSWIGEPPVRLSEDNGNLIYSQGHTVDFKGKGALWASSYKIRGQAWLNGSYGTCIYSPDNSTPEDARFLPGCPGGFTVGAGDGIVTPFPYEKRLGGITLATGSGRWGFGDYYRAAAVGQERTNVVGFYLGFD